VLPAILRGSPPLLVAVVGAAAIMFAALYLTHGVNVHTSVAIAGTLASLVLTYAGAALPLLLLLATGSRPVSDVLTGQLLAQEVLRSAVGTIGLVASVPITTGLAVLIADPSVRSRSAGRRSSPPSPSPRHSRT
jgi:uncharacterized membrane protein